MRCVALSPAQPIPGHWANGDGTGSGHSMGCMTIKHRGAPRIWGMHSAVHMGPCHLLSLSPSRSMLPSAALAESSTLHQHHHYLTGWSEGGKPASMHDTGRCVRRPGRSRAGVSGQGSSKPQKHNP